MAVAWDSKQQHEVQLLALTGYNVERSRHYVLTVKDAAAARKFVADITRQPLVTFGDRAADKQLTNTVNIGFTFKGLEALGLPDRYLDEVREKALAFSEGAPSRAARRLGDTGLSAVEHWEEMFHFDRAHVLISLHCNNEEELESLDKQLQSDSAKEGFDGWQKNKLEGKQLTGKKNRTVHFGFRDGIANPVIVDSEKVSEARLHKAGELLLGYLNDANFDPWRNVSEEVTQFFRNGSFAAVRKIEQDVETFTKFVNEQAAAHKVEPEYIKAKLCGRWPNGAPVEPGKDEMPDPPPPKDKLDNFKFGADDPDGFGCPFGAHIRRTNPREDRIAPSRPRPLFRRGMPYGEPYKETEKDKDASREKINGKGQGSSRGVIGLFFCSSIEDQFEHVVSEWIEKKPMGPPNRDGVKDPLVGQHDDPKSEFHIPRAHPQGDIKLAGFTSFVTTRGTLYAFFPSRAALKEIAGIEPRGSKAAHPRDAKRAGSLPDRIPKPERTDSTTSWIDRDTAPSDRFCDIVMEGGVTSGIIYSSAVVELAKEYRFKNIGGSSIGAFAAALTAAAEFRRRNGSVEGFQVMAGLPTALAEEGDERKTRLQRLFIPQDKTRRLFNIFLAMLGKEKSSRRLFAGLREAIRQYLVFVLVAALATATLVMVGPFVLTWISLTTLRLESLGLHLLGLSSMALALLLLLIAAITVALLAGILIDVRRGLVPNGFGLCRGWSEGDTLASEDLAGYLYSSIQMAAGRNAINDAPLTFKDLWNAPGSATDKLSGWEGSSDYAKRSINLEVYATNLAHGRPYRFPLDAEADDTTRLFFKLKDLEPYFPKPILQHLRTHGRPYEPESKFGSDPPSTTETEQYIELPREDLPIAVAARLAMSFPLLISAVPLWAIDYEPKRGDRKLAKCWLSDGGLCSNFPIHLFDSFMPKWPTFGISLHTRSPYRPDQLVWLPQRHFEGRADTWDRGMECGLPPLKRLGGFVTSLWMATWHWNDMTMMRMPGVRDRVVRVLLKEGQGGVNIKMTRDEIRDLAKDYGKQAADAFVEKFAHEDSPGWEEHRWVRFNRLLVSLREQIECFAFAAGIDRYTTPLRLKIDSSSLTGPLRGHKDAPPDQLAASEQPLKPEQVKELQDLLDALSELESTFNTAGNNKPYEAMPRPNLRVRHPT